MDSSIAIHEYVSIFMNVLFDYFMIFEFIEVRDHFRSSSGVYSLPMDRVWLLICIGRHGVSMLVFDTTRVYKRFSLEGYIVK